MFTIFHNPRCSKSRQTLQLLEQHHVEFSIVEYLKTPPTETQIQQLLTLLNLKPIELMRTKEKEFKELNLAQATDQQLIEAMVFTPKLIERPIVFNKDKACIGRPPENVLALIND